MEKKRHVAETTEQNDLESPPHEGDIRVSTNRSETITSDRPTVAEQAAALLKAATRASRRDGLEREANGRANVFTESTVALGAAALNGSLSSMDVVPLSASAPFGVVALMVGATLPFLRLMSACRPTVLHLAEGHDIQCLRTSNRQSDDPGITLALHPRDHNAENVSVPLARHRLAEAFEVIAHASRSTNDKNTFDSIVIPESVTRQAGLALAADRLYADVISGTTVEPVKIPYDEGERAVVISVSQAEAIVEQLRSDHDAMTARVLAELTKRHPGAGDSLTIDNLDIVPALHGILRRLAYSEGRVTRWKPATEQMTVDRADGLGTETREVFIGRRKVSEDVTPTLDTRNQYNPRLTYRSQLGEEISNRDLRSITGGEAMAEMIMQQPDDGVDDMALIRVALELLEAATLKTEEPPKDFDLEATLAAQAVTSEPPRMTIGDDFNRWKYRRRAGIKMLLGGAALFGMLQTINLLSQLSDEMPKLVSKQNGGAQFRVENHGLLQESEYWEQQTSYVFRDGAWQDGTHSPVSALALPRQLSQPNRPHLTVETVLGNKDIALPIEEDTRLAAVRATDVHGKLVKVHTYKTADGVTRIDGNDAVNGAYIEYDLISGGDGNIHADQPLTVVGEMYKSDAWKKEFSGPVAGAAFVRNHSIYDDSQSIKDDLAHTTSPSDYVDHLLNNERCQCLQCNTEVALLESQVRPDEKLALVSGYLHPSDKEGSHSYLVEGHAWLNNGKTIDATAAKTDGNSVVPHYDDTATLDKAWNKTVEQPLQAIHDKDQKERTLVWSLVGALAVGAFGVEARWRPVRRATSTYLDWDRRVTAHFDLAADDALRLMGWQAYGTFESPVPEIGEGAHGTVPKEENIPIKVLEEIAHGEFQASGHLTLVQQRGLRHAAATIRHSRR